MSAWLAALGRRFFGYRLLIGLFVTAVGLEVLRPAPFLAEGYRLGQGFALLLILVGLALRAWGGGSAGRHTREDSLQAPELITSGPFAHVRNPIYAGSICLGAGMCVLIGDPIAFILATLAFLILYVSIVPAEEAFLFQQFGDEYQRYRAEVPRLIPRLRPWRGRSRRPFEWRAARGELYIGLLLIGIYAALLYEERWDQFLP
ncbi:MAG: isoprenylcysteine carboxylmethyltransferase family protein [Verrucomicrobiota bacterium]|nr:isoprenylcysteine carboxylmethyltransferase family protein [Verrucomicrobiota bacterium]